MDVAATIKGYIDRSFVGQGGGGVGADDSLLDSGLIDSTGIFELVTFLETTFGIEVADEEIVPQNFETATNIASFVAGKRGG